MRGYTIEGILESGMTLAPLVLLPLAALICAIVLAVGLLRRRPIAVVAAIVVGCGIALAAVAARGSFVAPAAVDMLAMQIPIALVLAAVPVAIRSVLAAVRARQAGVLTVNDLAPVSPAFELDLLAPNYLTPSYLMPSSAARAASSLSRAA